MMGKNTFLDLDGTVVPDIEMEEEKAEKVKDDKKIIKDPEEDEPEEDEDEEEEESDEDEESEEDDESVEVLRTQKAQLEQDLGEARDAGARVEAEMKSMTVGRLKQERASAEALLKEFENRLKADRDEMVKAKTEGDSGAEAILANRIDDLKDGIRDCKGLVEKLVGQVTEAEKDAPARGQKSIPPLTKRWLNNNPWFNTPGQAYASDTATIISKQVEREGLPANTEKHFQEVSRRLARHFPKLGVKHVTGEKVALGTRKRGGTGKISPVDGGRTRGSHGGKDADARRLTDEDKSIMRTFRLDPTDKAQVQEYMRGKVNMAKSKE